jgi:hypothetical protein
MRLWSIHPRYLDARGLTALWREGLLAQRVLEGRTRGYTGHPQLLRFRQAPDPLAAIGAYLVAVRREARDRGYAFREELILVNESAATLKVTRGQLDFELEHLRDKLERRDTEACRRLPAPGQARPHPLFRVVRGGPEPWEKR